MASHPAPRPSSTRARSRRRVGLAGTAVAALLTGATALPAAAFQGNPDNGPSASGAPDTSGRCAPATNRVFTGSIRGADDLGVNVTVGFDMKDTAGHTIDLATGCAANGYSTIVQLNHDIGALGQAVGTATRPTRDAAGSTVTDRYTISGIPANITNAWIETYSRGADGSPCGWSCAGKVDVTKYGQVNRREIGLDTGGVDIRLPLTPAYGGSTGALDVTVVDRAGHPYPVQKSYTWSMLPDGRRTDQGWGIGVQGGAGRITTTALGSSQDYVSWVYTDRGIYVVKHLGIRPSATTSYRLNVDGPKTVDLTTLPARGAALTGRTPKGCQATTRGTAVTVTCTASRAPKNSRATLSYFGYGKWIPLHVTQVGERGTFRVAKNMRYVGSQQWRVQAGGKTWGYTVTGRP